MPHPANDHIGARVARTRKLRRLTQRELAARSHVSYSTITKVEQGVLPASPSVTGALARALSVPVTDLTGQPYIEELRQDQLDSLIQPIREALDVHDLGADPEITPRSPGELEEHAETLCALVRAGAIKQAGAEVAGLIHEVVTAANLTPSDDLWRTLASVYRTAFDVASKLGYSDLCTVALDRGEWAAQRASDAAISAIRHYQRALVYLRAGDYRTGTRLIQRGLVILEQADAGRVRDVVTGQLHLGAAMLAARSKDGDAAEGHLTEADRVAGRTGPAEKVHWLAFGPANVGVHRVSALAELDMYPEAVAAAKGLSIPAGWPPSRLSHHHAEVARAQLWAGSPDAAFASLREARRVAPQQARYHPLVRGTFTALLGRARKSPETLSGYGRWLGM